MRQDWEKNLKNFDRVWERVGGRHMPPPPPPGPGPWGPPPPRPPKKKCCSHAVRFCPRGFRG